MLEYLMIMCAGEETEGSYVDRDGDHGGGRRGSRNGIPN